MRRYTTEVEWDDRRYYALQREHAAATENASQHKSRIETYKAAIESLAQDEARLEPLLTPVIEMFYDLVTTEYRDTNLTVCSHLASALTVIRTNHSSARSYLESEERFLANCTQTIAELSEKLEAYAGKDPKYRLTKQQVLDAFRHVDHVDPESIALYYWANNTAPVLRWEVHGILMTPSRNIFEKLNHGEPVKIALPPVEVRVQLENNHVTFHALNDADRFFNYSGPAVHPHVFGDGSGCLGDFGGPITEALHEQDFETVASVINMFLSTAITDDSAGKNWVHGLRIYENGCPRRISSGNLDIREYMPDPEHEGFFIRAPLPKSSRSETPTDDYNLAA